MIETLKSHQISPADVCRANGWGVGTRLVGDEGNGPTVIEITAIGRSSIMAIPISHKGKPEVCPREGSWVLWCRDWRLAE